MSHKSLIKNVSIDVAVRSHKCRYNKNHMILHGEKRLKVKEGRTAMYYCVECGKKFLAEGIRKLSEVMGGL